jgi:hypothetical protein
MLPCAQLADQLPHRLGAVRDHPKAAHFPILLGNRDRDRLGMDIKPKNRTFFCMAGSSPLVALDCVPLRFTD